MQQVIDLAVRFRRKVGLVGRSLTSHIATARDLGLLHAADGTLVDLGVLRDLPRRRGGAAHGGQPGRGGVGADADRDEHAQAGDAVARRRRRAVVARHPGQRARHLEPGEPPLPAWRRRALRTQRAHPRVGARVPGGAEAGAQPGPAAPLRAGARRVPSPGAPSPPGARDAACPPTGSICSRTATCWRSTARAPGRTSACRRAACCVDGKGVGEVGDVVLRDRRHLSEDGLVLAVLAIAQQSGELIAGPDLMSRGVVADEVSREVFEAARSDDPPGAGRDQPRVAHRPCRGQGRGPEGFTPIFQALGPSARDPPLRPRDVVDVHPVVVGVT